MPADRKCWDDVEVQSADDVQRSVDVTDWNAAVWYTGALPSRHPWVSTPGLYSLLARECPASVTVNVTFYSANDFSRTLLRSAYDMSRPSSVVCLSVCLSSVTLLHPTQRLELFGSIFAPPNSSGTCTVRIKSGQKFTEVLGDRAT